MTVMIRLKVTLFAALVALVALSSCNKPSNEWHEQKLRVMSYNVHNCVGTDGVRDYARVAGVISKYSPDLVAIQEPLRFGLRPQGPCRVGTGESGLVLCGNQIFVKIHSVRRDPEDNRLILPIRLYVLHTYQPV